MSTKNEPIQTTEELNAQLAELARVTAALQPEMQKRIATILASLAQLIQHCAPEAQLQ